MIAEIKERYVDFANEVPNINDMLNNIMMLANISNAKACNTRSRELLLSSISIFQ